ncbi:hypothetical protein LRQ11_23210, partial [Pseudomonas sp. MAFF 311095]|uniref:hypothetical protein n=1 Tax=Pseudomonas petroselini TaxID=2899822 RepID=UPI0020B35CB4
GTHRHAFQVFARLAWIWGCFAASAGQARSLQGCLIIAKVLWKCLVAFAMPSPRYQSIFLRHRTA